MYFFGKYDKYRCMRLVACHLIFNLSSGRLLTKVTLTIKKKKKKKTHRHSTFMSENFRNICKEFLKYDS